MRPSSAEARARRDARRLRRQSIPGDKVRSRRHTFLDVSSFAAFVRGRAPSGSDVLVSETKVWADFHPGNRSSDLVTCDLLPHPRAARWIQAFEKALDQRALLRLVVSSKEDFVPPEGSKVMEGEALALQLMKLEVVKGGNFVSQIDELGTVRFQGNSDSRQVSGQIPPRFKVRVPVFPGIVDADGKELLYDLEILVELDAEEGLEFTLRCPSFAIVMREALLDVVRLLTRELGDTYIVGMGRHATAEMPSFGER